MQKRIIAYIVLFVLVICSFSIDSYASDNHCEIFITEANILPGETGDVSVRIKNNPGIIGISFSLFWDDGLTLITAKNGRAFSALNFTKPYKNISGCNFTWYAGEIDETDIKDGNVLTVTFAVDESVKTDQPLNIRIVIDDVYDNDLNAVPIKAINSYVIAGNKTISAHCNYCGETHSGSFGTVINILHKTIYVLLKVLNFL